MTDDEKLIERLRHHRYNTWNDDLGPEPDKKLAADRIEQLLESGKGLAEAFATVAVKREMTEAKLTKTVDALKEIASYDNGPFAGIAYTARTVLDELEKTE